MVTTLLLLLLTLLRSDPPADRLTLSVKARPQMLLWGGDVRVECRVPRERAIEWVTFGIDGPDFFRSSTQRHDRVVYESLTHLPRTACGTYYAFCVVHLGDNLGVVSATPVPILAKGLNCDDEIVP